MSWLGRILTLASVGFRVISPFWFLVPILARSPVKLVTWGHLCPNWARLVNGWDAYWW